MPRSFLRVGFVASAVGTELFVEAKVEAVFGAVGDGLADHLAREVEVGEYLIEAAVGGGWRRTAR